MILGNDEATILKLAVDNQSTMFDGVVQYDYEDEKMFGASFSTGTIENPANPLIEVFRLEQGERGELDCKCHENDNCPFWIEGHFDEDMIDVYGDDRITCCINGCLESWDLEEDIREDLELQIREILSDHLSDTISKLNEIRIAISDILSPSDYFNVRQDDWEINVLDTYVDYAVNDGFTTKITPESYLDSEIQYLAGCQYFEEDTEFWSKVGSLIEDYKFDEALKMLQ